MANAMGESDKSGDSGPDAGPPNLDRLRRNFGTALSAVMDQGNITTQQLLNELHEAGRTIASVASSMGSTINNDQRQHLLQVADLVSQLDAGAVEDMRRGRYDFT